MKKKIIAAVMTVMLLYALAVGTQAEEIYDFDLSERDSRSEGEISELLERIPPEILDELPKEKSDDLTEYGGEFFIKKVTESLKGAVKPFFGTLSVLLGAVILSAVFNLFANTVAGEGLRDMFSLCSTLCIALCIFGGMRATFLTAEALLSTLSETMLIMIPTMEAVYIRGGNLTGAAVNATGVSLMIGFTEVLFAKVLQPFLYVAFVLGVTGAVTKNPGISFMSRTLRNIITGGVIAVMTLLSFGLALQAGGAASYDSFAAKTVKFAIGNYLPFVGGTISDSFSLFSGSLGVIKQSCGVIGIAVLAVALLPPLGILLMNRIAVGASGALSESLGCEREGILLAECKSVVTILIAVCSGAAVMYVIALGVFVRTPLAIG